MIAGTDGISGFRDFIASLGFEPPERIEPGRWVPFSTSGKHRDSAGRAKLFPDLEGGTVHDWRSGESWNWQLKRERQRSEVELAAWREKCAKSKREAEAERARELQQTAERAQAHLQTAAPADASHGYLKAKGIQAHGSRVYRGPLVLNGMRCDGALMIPARNSDGETLTLSFISPTGEKRFLNGPKPPGCYYSIGKPQSRIVICEGFATGASVYEATGEACAIAFDCGGLEPAAKAIRAKFPDADLILAVDNDIKDGAGNPGLDAATAAALAVGGLLAVPEMSGQKCDFNDLAQASGADAVKRAIESACAPSMSTPQPPQESGPGAVVASEWPQPQPLPPDLLPVQSFDFALLPESLRPWVEDICERTQCPPDFVAIPAIVALGAAIGRQVAIRPQGKSDWQEVANLWGCIIGRPGLMKSPSMEAALAPLKRLEIEAGRNFESERATYEAQSRAAKIRKEAGETAARKKLAKDVAADVGAELAVADAGHEPLPKRYVANDTSYESLGELLRGNPNGILVYRDELVSLLKGLDREDNTAARGFYLSGWAAAKAIHSTGSRGRARGWMRFVFQCWAPRNQGALPSMSGTPSKAVPAMMDYCNASG